MTELSRSLFLAAAGAAALPLPAIAGRRGDDMLIVNALGGFGNPNAPRGRPPSRTIEPRVVADARASGRDAVYVAPGHVAGPEEPFEATIRDISFWNARGCRQARIEKILGLNFVNHVREI